MRLMGWTDRSMLDRYGADLQVQRAIDAKRRRGDLYRPGRDGGICHGKHRLNHLRRRPARDG
jgi:hypothetical protein